MAISFFSFSLGLLPNTLLERDIDTTSSAPKSLNATTDTSNFTFSIRGQNEDQLFSSDLRFLQPIPQPSPTKVTPARPRPSIRNQQLNRNRNKTNPHAAFRRLIRRHQSTVP